MPEGAVRSPGLGVHACAVGEGGAEPSGGSIALSSCKVTSLVLVDVMLFEQYVLSARRETITWTHQRCPSHPFSWRLLPRLGRISAAGASCTQQK